MSRKGKYVPDKILLACVLGLALFGLLMQYSASSYSALTRTGDAFFYVKRQAAALAFSCALYPFVFRADTAILFKLRYLLLAVGLVLLSVVLIPGVGAENYGATVSSPFSLPTSPNSPWSSLCRAVWRKEAA